MKPRIVLVEMGGSSRYVVKTTADKGYMVDTTNGMKSDEMNMQTLIKGGYWVDYDGDLTPEDLAK